MSDVKISLCKKKIPCVDCDDTECWHHGKKEADCPKYKCDRPEEYRYECDRCGFIDWYIKEKRKHRIRR